MNISINKLDVSARQYTNFTVIYDIRNLQIITLENAAEDIWWFVYNNPSKQISPNQVCSYLSEIYSCSPETIVEDVSNFLSDLYNRGVIQFNSCYADTEEINSSDIIEHIDLEGEIINQLQDNNQLYSATLELTYLCNEKCIHCYAVNPNSCYEIHCLNFEEWKSVIDDLFENNCLHLSFTGGDPFMIKDFEELFIYARIKGFVCDIYTNAQYLADHPDTLDRICKYRPRAFYISLYGAESQIHDKVTRVTGSFCKTINAIKAIVSNKIPVILNVMLMTVNYNQLNSIIDLAKSLNVEYRIGMSLIYKNDGDSSPMNYFINDKEKIKHVLQIVNDKAYSVDISIQDNNIYSNKNMCNAGKTALSITPDGTVYPCVSLKYPLGNILSESISQIWNSNHRIEYVNSLTWNNTKKCKKCGLKEDCPHCIGISQFETGDVFECNTCDHLIAQCVQEIRNQKKELS